MRKKPGLIGRMADSSNATKFIEFDVNENSLIAYIHSNTNTRHAYGYLTANCSYSYAKNKTIFNERYRIETTFWIGDGVLHTQKHLASLFYGHIDTALLYTTHTTYV